MNLFKFLKSRIGAVSLSAGKTAGLALTVGVLGLNVYNYATDRPAAQEERVRSFSEILASGNTLPGDTTMSISTGNVEFASPDEIAAREGSLFDGGDSAVAAFAGAAGGLSVSGSSLGTGEDGLGMGANAAVALGPDGKPLTGNVSGADGSAVGAAAAQANQTKINKLGETPEGGLQRASIARASGSNLGSGARGGFGGASSGRSSAAASGAARGEAAARMGDYALSGAMPQGSTLIASNPNIRGAAGGRTQFIAGGREGRSASGADSKEGRSLREIAVASSKVAANADRSANEGTSPFMADEKLSGGITVQGDSLAEFQGTADTSFEDDMNRRERGVAQAADEVDNTEQERKNHRTRLSKMLIALIPTVFLGMMTIQAMKKQVPWGLVAAIAVTALLGATIIAFTVDAGKYIAKYGGDGWSIASIVGSAVMAAGLALAWINSANKWLGTVSQFLMKNMGMQLISSAILGTFMGQAINTAPETFKNAFGSENDTSLKND